MFFSHFVTRGGRCGFAEPLLVCRDLGRCAISHRRVGGGGGVLFFYTYFLLLITFNVVRGGIPSAWLA